MKVRVMRNEAVALLPKASSAINVATAATCASIVTMIDDNRLADAADAFYALAFAAAPMFIDQYDVKCVTRVARRRVDAPQNNLR